MSTIANKIKAVRVGTGLTQEDFAYKIKISRSNLAQIETGKTNPTFDAIAAICQVFAVDANYFLDESKIDAPFVSDKEHKQNNFINIKYNTDNDDLNSTYDGILNPIFGEKDDFHDEVEVINKIQQNIRKISSLYSRLVDVRILIFQELNVQGSSFSTDKEVQLLQQLARPSGYTENGKNVFGYKYENLDFEGKKGFLAQQANCIELFTDTFFDLFGQLYTGIRIPGDDELAKDFMDKRMKITGAFKYPHLQ